MAPMNRVAPRVASQLDEHVDETETDRLTAKLAPESVGAALIRAGALLTGYELVKSSILDGVRGFFTFGYSESGPTVDPDYTTKVLPLAPGNVFRASVAWLLANGTFDQHHVDALERIRAHRGDVAHELARLLVDVEADVSAGLLCELRDCMRALDRFWGGIEVDIDPDIDGAEVDYDGIRSGSGLLLDYLVSLCGLDGSTE